MHDPHVSVPEPYPLVFFDGDFVPIADAVVPVTTHALHYGTAAFEGIRAYGDGAVAALFCGREHYERLLYHASLLRLELSYTVDDLIEYTRELLRRNRGYGDSYIRPLAFCSSPRFGAGLWPEAGLVIYAFPMNRGPDARPAARATISRWRRFPKTSCPSGTKICGLYVNSSFARSDALTRGYDQPLLLEQDGTVAEGYGANLFAVFGSRVITPPVDTDILPGITRSLVIAHFNTDRDDLTCAEERIAPERLHEADEVFLCGTGMEFTPIGSIDDQPIGAAGVGPITQATAEWYRKLVTGVLPESAQHRIAV